MNARTQITMDPEMQRRAQARAAELGISFAEYIRRVVANDLGERKSKVDVSVIFDLGSSDVPTDIARDKHKMIGQAAWDDHVRSTGTHAEPPLERRAGRQR
jgi:hypothetical protein